MTDSELLKAYQDTGLGPEDIESLKIIPATNELLAYRALGTVEELSALVKARDIIVETAADREYIDYICPKCKDIISQRRKGQRQGIYQPKYHDNCGQRLNWIRAEAEAAIGGGGDGS